MRKLLLTLLGFTVIGITANAQGGFRLGVKAGANMNKISGQSFKDGYDLSYHVGAFAEIDITKTIGIQPEVLWNQTTTKRANSFDAIYASLPQDVKLQYLAIPVLLRINVTNLITLNAGPQFGILMNKDDNLITNGQAAFKSGDFSLVAGAQLNLTALRIYGRYNIGLQNVNDVANQEKWKNQQIQLGVGLRF
ncbi:MAG: porin family protein [Sphingobacteriia bacterium]|nr:porin family protein [Sphingobacteriia bacterium]